jgi:hypothetical protein
MKITEQLTRKIGPLPVWAWGAIGAAGILIVRSWTRAQAPAPDGDWVEGSGIKSPGTVAMLPGSAPIADQPAFGENLFVSFPWGEGYVSVEGSAQHVGGILAGIPLMPVGGSPQQNTQPPTGTPIYTPPPLAPAPSPVAAAPTVSVYQPPTQTGYYEAPEVFPAHPVYVGEYVQTSPTTGGGSGLPTCGPGFYAAVGNYNPATNSYDMICKPL